MNDKNKGKIYYTIFTIVLVVAAIIITFALLNKNNDKDNKELSYTELINKIDENAVEKIEMTVGSTSIKVKLKNEEEKKEAIIPIFTPWVRPPNNKGVKDKIQTNLWRNELQHKYANPPTNGAPYENTAKSWVIRLPSLSVPEYLLTARLLFIFKSEEKSNKLDRWNPCEINTFIDLANPNTVQKITIVIIFFSS